MAQKGLSKEAELILESIDSNMRSINIAKADKRRNTAHSLEKDFEKILRDPKIQAEAEAFSRITIPRESLYRPFTR